MVIEGIEALSEGWEVRPEGTAFRTDGRGAVVSVVALGSHRVFAVHGGEYAPAPGAVRIALSVGALERLLAMARHVEALAELDAACARARAALAGPTPTLGK